MRSWNIPWGVILAGFPVENSNFLSVLVPMLSDPSFAILISTLKNTTKERKGEKQKKKISHAITESLVKLKDFLFVIHFSLTYKQMLCQVV